MRVHLLLVGLLSLGTPGCKKTVTDSANTATGTPSAPAEMPQPKIEACALISKEDVATIQGSDIVETKQSAGLNGSFIVSHCYYTSGEPNKSVSVAVTQSDPRDTKSTSPSKYWENTFAPYRAEKPEIKREKEETVERRGQKGASASGKKEEEEKGRPPKKIAGVGQEAFWEGNRFGGALYVLKGEVILRISVGGPDNEEEKIEKSRKLALKVLARL